MNSIRIHKLERQIPSAWNELTTRQVKRVVNVLQLALPPRELQMRLFLAVWISGWWDIRGRYTAWLLFNMLEHDNYEVRQDAWEEIKQLLNLVDYLMKENGLTKNPYPALKVRGKRLYGPDDDMEGLTAGEFAWAEKCFTTYMQEKDMAHLDELVAALWRPARADYDPVLHADNRVPFKPHLVANNCRLTKKLAEVVKMSLLTWYGACRMEKLKNIPKADQEKANQYGWLGVFLELAGGVKDLEQVANQPLDLILVEINRLMDKQKKK